MKKLMYFVPVLIFLLFTFLGSRVFASGSFNPGSMLIIFAVAMVLMLAIRPKTKQNVKPVADVEQSIRGEFAKDAFLDDPQLNAKFQSALKDFSTNMPKSALNKLTKLAPLCRNNQEKYAVAIATAQIQLKLGKTVDAARQYTTALVIHPTSALAMEQGSCYQRLGELSKARSAYNYALDLDNSNLEAYSSIATTYVADGDYQLAVDTAAKVLEKNENHASALATTAICYGLLKDPVMSKHYTDRAVVNGYSQKKIKDTISALEK